MKNRLFKSDVQNIYVAGDLHGDYNSYKKILRIHEKSEKNSLLLFLGDYADRGPDGLEIIMHLKDLLDTQNRVIAIKGNHEVYKNGKPGFYPSDLVDEAELKYESWDRFYHKIFLPFLSKLFIAAIINKVLFVHAGISSVIKSESELENPANENILLWSDPSSLLGERSDFRGAGMEFGEDITGKVLSALGLELIIRSHEPAKAAYGPFTEHGGRIITINSCNSYGKAWKPFLLKVDTKALKSETVYL